MQIKRPKLLSPKANTKMRVVLLMAAILFSLSTLHAQSVGRIYGEVESAQVDVHPVGATVYALGLTPAIGTTVGDDRTFSLTLPVGWQTIEVRCVGYEPQRQTVLVRTGQDQHLVFRLNVSTTTLEEVTVVRHTDKHRSLNPISFAGSRSFSTEETFRFAGSLGDPARMVRNFAGVLSMNDMRNDIVIRGNSPLSMQWRIDGFEIMNPNHFNAGIGMSGGQVTMVNTNFMTHSDFQMSGWPATFGNALSGVFDINYKEGNRHRHQGFVHNGFNGLELGLQGPLGSRGKGSYIASYRYSFLQLMNTLGVKMGMVPKYQDFTAKLVYDITPRQTLSLLTIAGPSKILIDPDKEPTEVDGEKVDPQRVELLSTKAFIGLTHRWQPARYSTLSTRLSYAFTEIDMHFAQYSLDDASTMIRFVDRSREHSLRFSSDYVHIGLSHRLNAGVMVNHTMPSYKQEVEGIDLTNINSAAPVTLLSGYTQYTHSFLEDDAVTTTAGVHAMWLLLNNSFALEPRLGVQYRFLNKHSIGLSGGLYSQTQNNPLYFVQSKDGKSFPNKSLGMTHTVHTCLAYNYAISEHWHLKLEGYHQYLYDVPVESDPSSTFSSLNLGAKENYVERRSGLVNRGVGRNYGVELSLERYLSRNFYLLMTGTLYRSLYATEKGGTRYSTAFDGRFITNLNAGYEHPFNSRWTGLCNIRLAYAGGLRYTPFLIEESMRRNEEVLDESRPFTEKMSDYSNISVRLGARMTTKKWSHEWAFDLQNITNSANPIAVVLNPHTGHLLNLSGMGFFPMVTYRAYFNF